MAQHDYVIANGTGAAVRSDLNAGLAAIVSQNSGATAPSTTYAYQPWADTSAGVMKMRNGANNAWITLYQLDGEWSTIAFENGTAAAPSIYFKDSGTDTGIYSPGADQVGISTGGTARITVDGSGNVNIDSNTLYVDAANNRVGIGTSSPSQKLQIATGNVQIDSNYGFIWDNSTTGIYGTSSPSVLQFYTGNAERMRVTSTGVGVGTTSPVARLDVLAAAASTVIHATDGTNADLFLDFPSSTITRFVSEFGAGGQFVFANGTGKTERMRIDASGRLGIGTSSPSGTLEVGAIAGAVTAGDLLVSTGSTTASVTVGRISSTSSDSTTFRVRNRVNSTVFVVDGPTERVGIGTTSPLFPLDVNGVIYTRGRGSTFGVLFDDWRIYNSTAPGALVFDNGSERARIDSSGRLLVGGSPDSGGALLQVFGDRIRVGTAKTPASASDTGTAGEICWDASYIYVCTATNTWKRTAIATW